MNSRTYPLAASLVLLISGPVTASAQSTNAPAKIIYAPEPSTPPALKDIQIDSPTLRLSELFYSSELWFEENGGRLLLKVPTPAKGFVIPAPDPQTLWASKLDFQAHPFVFEETSTRQDLKDNMGKVLWSQPLPPANLRLFFTDTIIKFEVSRDMGSLNISDKGHRLLETVPDETLRFAVLSGDKEFRSRSRNYFLYHSPPATTQVSLTAPGLIYVQYRMASGEWAGEESVHAIAGTQQFVSSHKFDLLDTWRGYFDKSGKRVNTFHNGARLLQEE